MLMFITLILSLFYLSWGSFLNVVAFRLVNDVSFLKSRSFCPLCQKKISFYDNIPLISWILLRGRCRHCNGRISVLYPFIEMITFVLMFALTVHVFDGLPVNLDSLSTFFSYFVFFTALIISTRTDLQAMVIPQLFTLWLVPIAILFAFLGFLKITLFQSLVGAFFGYAILWGIAKLFKVITKRDGMGVGDMEFLAMIGAFLGPVGVWFSLTIASLIGVILGGGYLFINKKIKGQIPFGPFLALGAILYFFYQDFIWNLIFT